MAWSRKIAWIRPLTPRSILFAIIVNYDSNFPIIQGEEELQQDNKFPLHVPLSEEPATIFM